MQPQAQVVTESVSEAQAAPAGPQSTPDKAWSLPARVGFRFGFAYFFLYSFPGPLGFLPRARGLFGWTDTLWQKIVIWTGTHVLHLSHPVQYSPTGSGDTMHDYIQNMLVLVFAVAGAALWSVLDRRRRHYIDLHEWLRFYVRLWLGATLLGYGAFKVIKSQFPYP